MPEAAGEIAYTEQDNFLKGPSLIRPSPFGPVLFRKFMTNLAEIEFPSQMRPELAKHLAEGLCWAPSGSNEVAFTSLALLFASWQSDKPSVLQEYATHLHSLFKRSDSTVLATLTNEDSYDSQALKHNVGALTTYHAKQALRLWASRLKPDSVATLSVMVSSVFIAAIEDESDRAQGLAATLLEGIDSMSSNKDGDAFEGIFIPGPTGPMGPFANVREAKSYMAKAMRAHIAGKPLPPIPPFPGQDEAAAEVPEDEPTVGPGLALYSKADAANMLQRLPPPTPGDGNMQQRRLLESMVTGKAWRPLSTVPAGNPLEQMYRRFPHFSAVLDFLTERLALAACGDEGNPVCIPPLLLRGIHGTGKSYFAKQLAKVLGAHYVERDLSVTTEAFVISGMDSAWRGSKHGIVFDTLLHGETANPVICLEEIDKAMGKGDKNSPISSLYSLLVDDSSKVFKDEFLPIPIDASRVNWICTANDGEIPVAVLDRLEVFEIKEPTQEECRIIAVSIWESLCVSKFPRGHGFPTELGDPLLDSMSMMRPRVMRNTLLDAAGKAALKGDKYMTLEDLAKAQLRYEPTQKAPMGFLAQA